MEEYKNNAVEKVQTITGEIIKDDTISTPQKREELRAEKRIELAKLKEERKERNERRKAEIRKRRLENKQKNKEEGRGNGGWLAAVISLGISTLVLASVLTFTYLMPSENDNTLESLYQKSFYDTVEQVDNIDLNLSKVLASSDKSAMQSYLTDIAVNAELAENDLQQLPIQDESKFYTTKLVNQIGDFSKYLNKKISQNEVLTEEDYANLLRLYEANLTFKESLKKMSEEMGDDFSFSSLQDGGTGNAVITGLNELENLSVSYPELIYDGPFSDGIQDRKVKGLTGEEINEYKAEEIFTQIFGSYGLEEINYVGETASNINAFNVEGMVNGDTLYAQISKTGGKLIMFAFSGSCNKVNFEQSVAIEKASAFLEDLGIGNMTPVWINLANNLYTINFAYKINDVIVYSDLIKIRVCAETGMVIGFEASEYYTNHVDRVIDNPVLSEKDAIEKVSSNIEIETSRLALVPIGNESEKICYEFMGEYDGATYYVYIDAINGRQLQMFKVVEGTEGTLLM